MSQGQCLCGAVEITAQQLSHEVGACHCRMCRRWGGGPLMATDCGTDVVLSDTDSVAVYDSSDWAERGFCKQCGSHLFYRLKQSGQYIMPVGLFDEDQMVLDHQVFVDERPNYYCFSGETKELTGLEVFAMFAGQSQD
ncbi:MAG: GFA family protein [Pseudomonadota bacterium]